MNELFSEISDFSANFSFVSANLINKKRHVTLLWNLSRNPDNISSNIRIKNTKFDAENEKKSEIHISSAKMLTIFGWHFEIWAVQKVQRSALCRSRQELCKEYICKNRRRYSRERAPWSLRKIIHYSFASFFISLARCIASSCGPGTTDVVSLNLV